MFAARKTIVATAAALSLMAGAALAEVKADDVTAALTTQGFTEIEIVSDEGDAITAHAMREGLPVAIVIGRESGAVVSAEARTDADAPVATTLPAPAEAAPAAETEAPLPPADVPAEEAPATGS